jgi:hypothetical protein
MCPVSVILLSDLHGCIYTSIGADLIALSVVIPVGACSGPHIPLRGGRVDATGAGPFGVPELEIGIDKTLNEFLGAGFDKSDSIALTACGHTM